MSGNTGETPRSSPTAASDADAPKTLVGKKALPRWLGLVAGWFDVVNMQQYGCYCNMMSGNTLNFSMKLGGGPRIPDVPFLLGTFLTFGTGYFVFKAIDNKKEHRGSCTTAAPLVVALFLLADLLRPRFPDARWHMWSPAAACGMVNAVSTVRLEPAVAFHLRLTGSVGCAGEGQRDHLHDHRPHDVALGLPRRLLPQGPHAKDPRDSRGLCWRALLLCRRVHRWDAAVDGVPSLRVALALAVHDHGAGVRCDPHRARAAPVARQGHRLEQLAGSCRSLRSDDGHGHSADSV